ncbi:MAG: 16S rRNA (guanine(527)-N(7))-methyltransferase [uncultured Solirubrobacteraceae bacterium]|uniref:Ribosomal RNA small subunit methyltransferase G n=1 Tax=uncultured Solirubrobacteraceae bacterium TaxID=1162706 RepID=A0A6J4TU57_9ACTN|nr:MAG: 16S rRNA (guanine(527)-N(7))-methyltransferase [uncultured Solirubrobacteraceae bacterium]
MNVARRLEQLAALHALPPGAAQALDRLLGLVSSDPAAPTTVRDPAVAVDAHVADALVALELDRVRAARHVADLGAGAGFPGLVLAAALPAAEVALVESNRRKCEFLERAAAQMGLANAVVVAERAESWPAGLGTRDLVTARALAPLAVLVEYAAPLLVEGGALLAWKGARDDAEEADGAAAAAATGLVLGEVRPVTPWNGAERLHLHLYVKVRTTPNRFPRRPGIASKRPLRASA